jgi:hypothetical protein
VRDLFICFAFLPPFFFQLRRASEQQRVYDEQFKQSRATRERRGIINDKDNENASNDTKNTKNNSSAEHHSANIKAAKSSNRTVSTTTASSSIPFTRPTLLGGGGGGSGSSNKGSGGGSGRLPNIPLLDLRSGKWKGLWDLFR